MAIRVPWDEYEAAYLLDNCIKIENGEISEKEAISKVSRDLRARAISLGTKIDDKFRNEAGIRMQLAAMRECYFGRISGLAMGKTFKEIVEIYKKHPEKFKEILQRNHTRAKENKKLDWPEFLIWLQNGEDYKKVQDILSALKSIDFVARVKRITRKPFSKITNVKEIEKLKTLVQNEAFGSRGNKRVKDAIKALDLYCLFLSGQEFPRKRKEEKPKIEEPIIVERQDEKVKGNKGNKRTFKEWLIEVKNLDEHTGDSYARGVEICEQLAIRYNLPNTKIYGVPAGEAKKTILFLRAEKEYAKENNRQHHRLSAALAKYWEYISSQNPIVKETPTGERPKNFTAIADIEKYLRSVDLKGATVAEIAAAVQCGADVSAIIRELEENINIIDMPNGHYVHADCFIDLDMAAERIGNILRRHFSQFNGYSNNRLLFDAALQELSMFLNDNDCADSDSVYAIARFLFEKKAVAGKPYSFFSPHIFEIGVDDPTHRGLMVSLARSNEGILNLENTKEYLRKAKIQSTVQNLTQIGVLSSNRFLIYDIDNYLLSEMLNINKGWCKQVHDSLDNLLRQANIAYVIPRDINPVWFNNLPKLPNKLPWTHLLLQEIIKKYPDVGFKVISPNISQDNDTIAAAFVPAGSPIQSFPDLVALFVSEYYKLPVKMSGENLRVKLRDAGMLQGTELHNIIHKALDDSRFAWSNSNKDVRISK